MGKNNNPKQESAMSDLNTVAELLKKKIAEAFEAGKREGQNALLQTLQSSLSDAAPSEAPAKNKGGRPKGSGKAKAKGKKAPAKKAKGKGGRPRKGYSKNGVKLGRPPKAKADAAPVTNGHNAPTPTISEALAAIVASA